jgi:arylsulfatase A-like enzyme
MRSDQFSTHSRRDFIKMAGGAGIFAAASGTLNLFANNQATELTQTNRNVILFATDQQQELRWFPEGWEAANIPGLTRLRNKGVSFTKAYTNTAMCTPSRTTLLTGLYPAQHRNTDTLSEGMSQSEEEHQLDPSIPNLCTIMQAAGYDVVWKGKWHLSKGTEHPDGTYSEDDIARYGANEWNKPDAGGDAKLKNYGGGHTNHDGRYFDGSTWQDPTGNPEDPDYIFTQADGPINEEYEKESVMAFLRHKIEHPGGNPFCLIICLINPHDVLGCPGLSQINGTYIEGGYFGTENGSPWSEQTGPIPIELPPTVSEELNANLKPTCQQAFAQSLAGLGPILTNRKKLEYLNFYGNLLKLVDRYLIKMLDLLDGLDGTVAPEAATALRDNSWLIFLSDHGDMATTHGGLRQKSFMCYEEVVNIPLIWSNSVDYSEPAVCNELVSHVDFVPTLCSVLGINTSAYELKGVDYSALLTNPAGPAVQDSILFTFDDIWSGQNAGENTNGIISAPNRIRALIEKDYKFAHYFDGQGIEPQQEEFYDMRTRDDGGTDADAATGQALEYINYSEWAENQRDESKKLITEPLATKREQMRVDLDAAINSKLAPLPPAPAVAPDAYQAKTYRWNDPDTAEAMSAVQLTWLSRFHTQYQLQSSPDLAEWTKVGDPIHGNNGPIWSDHEVAGKQFFRLVWAAVVEPPVPQPDLS